MAMMMADAVVAMILATTMTMMPMTDVLPPLSAAAAFRPWASGRWLWTLVWLHGDENNNSSGYDEAI